MSKNDEKRKISEIIKEHILRELIEPSYITDVNETLKGRKCWRVSGHVFESASKILLAVSGVLSFAAGVYDDKILSFVAGTLSTVSLATFQFSLYSFKMHKKNSLELNQLLDKLDIDTVPIFETITTKSSVQDIPSEITEPSMMCRQADTKPEEIEMVSVDVYKIDDDTKEKNKDYKMDEID